MQGWKIGVLKRANHVDWLEALAGFVTIAPWIANGMTGSRHDATTAEPIEETNKKTVGQFALAPPHRLILKPARESRSRKSRNPTPRRLSDDPLSQARAGH